MSSAAAMMEPVPVEASGRDAGKAAHENNKLHKRLCRLVSRLDVSLAVGVQHGGRRENDEVHDEVREEHADEDVGTRGLKL